MVKPRYLDALVLGFTRSISGADGASIVPNVVFSETHVDDVTATRHPVDMGANISDHAYREPASLVCEFGWTDSAILVNSLLDRSIFHGLRTTHDVYATLIGLKDSLQLLTITTGKRAYRNMLITQLKTTTTEDTENALRIEITFQEILTVSAAEVSLNAGLLQNASKAAPAQERGSIAAKLNERGRR